MRRPYWKGKRRRVPRTLRRAGERGSVIFIVIMAMLLLTSLGTWVIYAGGIASNSAGYQRSSSQTLYLSELAVLSGTSYLAQPGKARDNYFLAEQALRNPGAVTPDSCASVPAGVQPQPCKSIFLSEVNAEVVNANASGYNLLDTTAGGSFGPYANSLDGDFWIELSGFRSAVVMGSTVGRNPYRQVTISSYATVRPSGGVAAICTGADGPNSAATLVGMRAFSVIGPVE